MSIQPYQIAPIVELIGSVIPDIQPYTEIVGDVLEDPYLPQTIDLFSQISDTYPARPAGSGPAPPGAGLDGLQWPLKTFLFVRRHPWSPWVVGAALLAVPVLVGVLLGKRTCSV